ncbi:hypothetical protein ACFFK0_23220 [Paenibacillus chartarius]|uniref:Uncharacterized protein n=1 Tax=Paenibacillus chartarius TaxID=747481 RepID=A0ABV6DRN4_9BACL
MEYAFVIKPSTYIAFDDEEQLMDKCKDWGLLSEKAGKSKSYAYKGNGLNVPCRVIGYADDMTAVIEFDNNQLHCIHPSYLKEMQAASFSQRLTASADEGDEPESAEAPKQAESVTSGNEGEPKKVSAPKAPKEPKEPKAKTEKTEKTARKKLELPEDKVKMTATVKEFTTVPNHFAEQDDEVVIYEDVTLVDTDTAVGAAWSSYSATLKKLELAEGDKLSFEAKIVAKKLTRHPVPYKINNPSKMTKQES